MFVATSSNGATGSFSPHLPSQANTLLYWLFSLLDHSSFPWPSIGGEFHFDGIPVSANLTTCRYVKDDDSSDKFFAGDVPEPEEQKKKKWF